MCMKNVQPLKSPISELPCKVCKQKLDFLCAWHIIHLRANILEEINEVNTFFRNAIGKMYASAKEKNKITTKVPFNLFIVSKQIQCGNSTASLTFKKVIN